MTSFEKAEINTADHIVIDGRTYGRVKPLTGRDRNPGVTFTPATIDSVTGATVWGDPIDISGIKRWTEDTSPKVSPALVSAVLDLCNKSKWFKAGRERLGLSQSQLGHILDTGPRTIRQWEAEDVLNSRDPNPIACRVMQWMLDGYRPPEWPQPKAIVKSAVAS